MAPSSKAQEGVEVETGGTVNVHDAKTHFSKLLERVSAGEEIIIAKANRPVARLMPLATPRAWGAARGKVWMSADFDEAMPELDTDKYR